MKKIFCFIFLFIPFFASAQNWNSSLSAAVAKGAEQNKFVFVGFDSGNTRKNHFTKSKEFREYANKNLILVRVRISPGLDYKIADPKNKEAAAKLGMSPAGYYIVAPNGKIASFSYNAPSNKEVALAIESKCKALLVPSDAVFARSIAVVNPKKDDFWQEDFSKALAAAKKRKKLALLTFAPIPSFSGGIVLKSQDFKNYASKNFECIAVEIILLRSGKLEAMPDKNNAQNGQLVARYLQAADNSKFQTGYFVFINPETDFAICVSNVYNFEDLQRTAEAFKKGNFEFYTITQKIPFYAVYWDKVKQDALKSGKKIIIVKNQFNLEDYCASIDCEKFVGFLHGPCVFRKDEPLVYRSEMFDELDVSRNSACVYDPKKDEYDIVELRRLDAYLKKF